jgi:ethanolamine utilization protein EutA
VTTDGHAHDGHAHDGHAHAHDDVELDDDRHPLWLTDQVKLVSVGIDVGSATTQVVFSEIIMRRLGRELSSRYVVVARELLHASRVHLTPYAESDSGPRIDECAIRGIVAEGFREAGMTRAEVDSGAVILTGEATRRHNARAIADALAAESGNFVCVTAGHHIEATLAAHGSGAVAHSQRSGGAVLNIDMGGGTTKFTVAESGKVVSTAAMHIGGRLIAQGVSGELVRLEPMAQEIADHLGFRWHLGCRPATEELKAMASWMCAAVVEFAQGGRLPPDTVPSLLLTPSLSRGGPYDAVFFSGGVAEYIYGNESGVFGDLGHVLGEEMRRRVRGLPGPLLRPSGGIRATVLGASQYTVQVSGSTVFITDPSPLPLADLRVIRPALSLAGEMSAEFVCSAITEHVAVFDVDLDAPVALAFRWEGAPSFARLNSFAVGLARALEPRLVAGLPLVVIFEGDVAQSIGALLDEQVRGRAAIVSVDEIEVSDFDFVDVGRALPDSGTVPISIKSLVFQL